ncbi:hypothetical protein CYMTET_7738 [Cymbomonas tetramitiformis]|uniref:Uncharacterized protein n=1 Tax=Cymbomonas tetramitiformis TaxID=36881 RepID=A0AAE0GUY2_9CHLO|nr:hypothetical protein CYMTET_7738 [Cymbomonas tetramitiformis]
MQKEVACGGLPRWALRFLGMDSNHSASPVASNNLCTLPAVGRERCAISECKDAQGLFMRPALAMSKYDYCDDLQRSVGLDNNITMCTHEDP